MNAIQLHEARTDAIRRAAREPSPLAALLRIGEELSGDPHRPEARDASIDELERTLRAAHAPDGLAAVERRRLRDEELGLLEDLVRRAQAAGEIAAHSDPRALALTLHAWSIGLQHLALEVPDEIAAAPLFATYRTLLLGPAPASASTGNGTHAANGVHATNGTRATKPVVIAPASPAPNRAPIPAPTPVPMPAHAQGKRVEDNAHLLADLSGFALLASAPKVRKGGGAPLLESFASAFGSLAANKMRSMLTMLGIIIGVGSVVSLLAIGNGVTANVTGQLNSQGTNLIAVQGASATTNGAANGPQNGSRVRSITVEDARALAAPGAVPNALAVSPEAQAGGQITVGNANVFATYIGVWPEYAFVHDAGVASGDFISDSDLTTASPVVVLGSNVATNLFGTDDPLGKTVRITGKGFRVIGVMQAKGGSFTSPDDQVFVPLPTALNTLIGDVGGASAGASGGRTIPAILLKGTSPETVDLAVAEITEILNQRHRTPEGSKPDYQVTTQADIIKSVQTTLGVINIFLAVVAGISLLVGGIGIMNIMLVSVTERTREIGIRKAVGAKESDILTQFVMEAVLISLFGAAIGVAFGLAVSAIVSRVWQPSAPSVSAIVVSVTVAMLTGLFFGVYPARRAARLKPIDALRYE